MPTDRAAVESRSSVCLSNVQQHGQDPKGCDLIVCWEDDWPSCPVEVLELKDAIKETVTAGSSSLSYDPVADQYVYVWKTAKAWANTCRQLMVRFNDLTEHVANFKFK